RRAGYTPGFARPGPATTRRGRMSDFHVSFSLEGRVVAVTGAAQGIGQGVAVAAAQAGADVAVVDLTEEAASETTALVEAEGRRALPVGVDVGDRDAVL